MTLIAVDWDRDGDPDLIQTCNGGPLRFLENRPSDPSTSPHYLMVRPRMDGPNHRAIGAVILVTVGGVAQMRLISAGTSYLGQEPAEALFGLGSAALVDELTIEWPDGSHTHLPDVVVDQTLTVQHGGFGDLDANGDVDVYDHRIFTECITGVSPGGVQYASTCRPADVNGDGGIDMSDPVYL